jgi:protein involved in temperature-dependent protein secretion
MLFKNSVRTSKRTPHFTITKINWLTLFKEIIAVYSEHHMKAVNTLREQNEQLCLLKQAVRITSEL